MPRTIKLSCGGKGPCCHVGYAHKHCEHCDVVIAFTQPYVLPYIQPWVNPAPAYPWWSTINRTYTFGDVANGRPTTANSWLPSFNATSADTSSYNVAALPDPTAAHTCDVSPAA